MRAPPKEDRTRRNYCESRRFERDGAWATSLSAAVSATAFGAAFESSLANSADKPACSGS